jgi:hypothetical protein
MKTRILLAALLIVGTVFLRGDGCIMKNKVFEIVVFAETTAEFENQSTSQSFINSISLFLDEEVDDALQDAGYSRDDILTAKVQGGHYGAVANNTSHDWTISGQITVERVGGTTGAVTAITYTSQSVDAALGKKIKAPIEAAAIDEVNDALSDYLAGQNGIELEFTIDNGSVSPSPDSGDPIDIVWKAWVTITVVVSDEADWPDPF